MRDAVLSIFAEYGIHSVNPTAALRTLAKKSGYHVLHGAANNAIQLKIISAAVAMARFIKIIEDTCCDQDANAHSERGSDTPLRNSIPPLCYRPLDQNKEPIAAPAPVFERTPAAIDSMTLVSAGTSSLLDDGGTLERKDNEPEAATGSNSERGETATKEQEAWEDPSHPENTGPLLTEIDNVGQRMWYQGHLRCGINTKPSRIDSGEPMKNFPLGTVVHKAQALSGDKRRTAATTSRCSAGEKGTVLRSPDGNYLLADGGK